MIQPALDDAIERNVPENCKNIGGNLAEFSIYERRVDDFQAKCSSPKSCRRFESGVDESSWKSF